MKAIRRFTVRPVLPEALHPLSDLARNLRWSWHAETRDLFQSVDPERWAECGGDPVRLLGSVPGGRLAELTEDSRFLRRLAAVRDDLREYVSGDRWYQTQTSDLPAAIAYFSPEFGITAALPQYSGGLGILAGDHLKAASDLGVPLIGVGLLYRHGYFRQSLSREGWQQEHYPVLDPNELPLVPLSEEDGTPALVSSRCPAAVRCAPGSGWPRSAASRCSCSTPTSRRTASANAGSPTGSTAAAANTGCSRRCCSV